jgi:general secretion pathway protein K
MLGPAIRDWLDSNAASLPSAGAEDDYYMGLDPTYRAANQLFQSPSELLAIEGVTPAVRAYLRIRLIQSRWRVFTQVS